MKRQNTKRIFAVMTKEGSIPGPGKWWKAKPEHVLKSDYYIDIAVNDKQRVRKVYKVADDQYHQGKIMNLKSGKKSMMYSYSLKEVDLAKDPIAAKIASMNVTEMRKHWNPTWYFDYDVDRNEFCNFGVLNW